MRGVLKWMAVGIFLSGFFAKAEVPSEVYDLPEVVALQNRANFLNDGITLTMGYLPSDAFNKGITFGGTYTYFFSDYLAWEVFNAHYNLNIETALKDDLVTNFPIEIENVGFEGRLDFPQYYLTSNIVYTPVYNKNLFFNDLVVNGEISFVLGGGMIRFKDTGFKPLVDGGMYLRYFLSPATSLKFDFRVNLYHDSTLGLQNFLSLIVGYSFQLGEAPEHLRKKR